MKTFVWKKNMAKVEKYDFMIHLLTFNVEILYDDIYNFMYFYINYVHFSLFFIIMCVLIYFFSCTACLLYMAC